jgi:hypothetical protein
MLDTGFDLEPDMAVHRSRLARALPGQWPQESVSVFKAGLTAGPSGVPLKRVYGSDFPFRAPAQAMEFRQEHTSAARSFAKGGLSRAWGATLLPAAADDIRTWPVSSRELEPHYEAVLKWVPLAAASDGLDTLFPLHGADAGDLRPSRQADAMLRDLSRHQRQLRERGVFFGRARLAVRTRSVGAHAGCIYCRFCLYGCPYGCIFSADQVLPELQSHPQFTYRTGVLVTDVRESAGTVALDVLDLHDVKTATLTGERVFLACGVITTTQLLMRALALDEVRIETSQSFLLPLLRYRPVQNVHEDEAHTLSQIFILVRDPSIARRLVMLQIYTHSDLMTEALMNSPVGPLVRRLPRLRRAVEDRLVVLQGLLPSEESDPLVMRREGAGFVLNGHVSSRTRATMRRVAALLRAVGAQAGFVPMTPFLRPGAPGQSFHTGASFPMSRTPGALQSDRLGRPGGLLRIHAVDATVLPDIPAPPLTLTVMANAHRIGTYAG